MNIQLPTFAFTRLLNKPYENEVALTGQNPPLKCCQHIERRRSFKSQLVRGRVNGVLVFQSDQRGVLMVSVGCWGPILGVQTLKGPGC